MYLLFIFKCPSVSNVVILYVIFFFLSEYKQHFRLNYLACVVDVAQLHKESIESDRVPEEQNQGRFVKALSVIRMEHVRFHCLQFPEHTQAKEDTQNVQPSFFPCCYAHG